MRFLTLVIKNLTRRRARSLLTLSGMAVAVAAVVALVGIADGFRGSFRELYTAHGVDIVVVRSRAADRMAGSLDASLGTRIADVSGVRSVESTLFDVVSFEDLGLYGIVVQGLDPAGSMIRDHELLAGRELRSGDSRAVLLGRLLAEHLGKQVGDELEIYEEIPFEVVGIYERFNVLENGAMIVPLAELQELLGQPDQVTMFYAQVNDASDGELVESVVHGIEDTAAGLNAMDVEQYIDTDPKIQAASAMAWSTSAIALLIGAIGMLNTMLVSVFERTGEIGVLRAIGWRRGRVVRMVLVESCLLCIVGALIGTIMAFALTQLLSRLPTSSVIVSGQIAPLVIVQGAGIALSIGLLGAAYPAFRAATLLPTEAIRHQG